MGSNDVDSGADRSVCASRSAKLPLPGIINFILNHYDLAEVLLYIN